MLKIDGGSHSFFNFFLMKKLLLTLGATLGITALLLPALAAAATLRMDENVPQTESLSGNLYLVGSAPVVAGTVVGDAMVAGGNVVVTGYIQEDATLTGGTVTLNGHVGGDVRVFGGQVFVDGTVDGELFVLGGNVEIGSRAIVKGESMINGGEVEVNPSAQLLGVQKISSGKDKSMVDPKIQETENWMQQFATSAFWVAFLFHLVALLVVGALIFGIFPEFSQRSVNEIAIKGNFWKSLGLGALMLFTLPVAILFCLLSGVGIFLGFILFILYIGAILISMVFAGVLLGGLLYHWLAKPKKFQLSWLWVMIGIVALQILNFIPFIGWAMGFVLLLLAMGALTRVKWQIMKNK